jgi:type I restriction enzyme S subunit
MSIEVPKGWASASLGDLLKIERGVSWSKDNETSATNCDAVAVVSIPNIKNRLILNDLRYIKRTSIKKIERYLARRGWILMVGSNGNPDRVGNCVQVDESGDFLFASFLLGLHPREDAPIRADYAYRVLASPIVQSSISASVQGTTGLNNISLKMLRALNIFLPSLEEQRRIAEILSSVDEAIQATQAVIDQTQAVKQGVLERLLTKGIGHTRFKQTVIGEIPESWRLATAQTICKQISVGIVVKPAQYYVEDGIRCFRSANIGEGYVKNDNWVYISPESNEILSKSKLKTGDVLIVRSGYPGTSCVVTPEFNECNCIDIIFARPKFDIIESTFLSSFINSRSGKEQVLRAEGGLAQKHFNVGEMKKMLVPVPPLAEQNEITAKVHELATTSNLLEVELKRLKLFKTAIMSDLLSGRVRVPADLPMAAE